MNRHSSSSDLTARWNSLHEGERRREDPRSHYLELPERHLPAPAFTVNAPRDNRSFELGYN